MKFEDFVSLYATAPEDRKRAALMVAANVLDGSKADGPEGTVTITRAAERSNTSRPTVYRAIRCGVLEAPPLYPGGRPRIREADFRRWLNARGGAA
ncbi:helix-turn-helix domain-containing protein [Verrucomicrobiota bacterium]